MILNYSHKIVPLFSLFLFRKCEMLNAVEVVEAMGVLKIKAVDETNFMAVVQLEMTPAQKEAKWLSDNVLSLAQCWLYRENNDSFPKAIYADDEVVGFVLLEIEPEGETILIWRIMIGQQFQGKGYGRAAVQAVIAEAAKEYPTRTVIADYVEGNQPMKQLLTNIGFKAVGYNEAHKEYIMHYKH